MASAGRNLAKLIGANQQVKLTGSGGDSDFNAALDSDATKLATLEREIKSRLDSDEANPITASTLNMGSNDVVTTGKMYFSNMFATEGDLPSASTYHGMFAHVHATGAAYFAHSGSWVKLANNSALSGSGGGFDSDQVVSIINENVTVGGGGITYESNIKDSDFTAVAGKGYFVDTTSGTVTVNLPTSASLGDEIIFIDYSDNWSTNSMFLYSPPLNYQSFADSDIEINSDDYRTVHIIYSGATQGWLPRKYDGGQHSSGALYGTDGPISGGYTYTTGGYRYYKFTSSATFVVADTVTAEAILVAGGGGGGRDDYSGGRGAGGGGAGGMINAQTLNLVSGNNLTVVIGAGGTNPGTNGAGGTNGGNTSVTGLTTATGGGGGGSHSTSTNLDNAGSGGSGGGATNGRTGKSGTSGQGNDGAAGYGGIFSYGGGGGGGKGAAATTNSGGAGSNTYSAWATATSSGDNGYYAGGGAGGGGANTAGVNGSNGGGGSSNNGPGTVNTGGGGGGNRYSTAGSGGSGIVIIRHAV